MLVLTRREGQRIFIGKDIVVQVEEISRHEVRLGIEAPADVAVLREELVKGKEPGRSR